MFLKFLSIDTPQQFDFDRHWSSFLHASCNCSLWIYIFQQIWDIFGHYFFNYFYAPSIREPIYTYIRKFEVVLKLPDNLFICLLIYFCITFCIVYIAMSLSSLFISSARSNLFILFYFLFFISWTPIFFFFCVFYDSI